MAGDASEWVASRLDDSPEPLSNWQPVDPPSFPEVDSPGTFRPPGPDDPFEHYAAGGMDVAALESPEPDERSASVRVAVCLSPNVEDARKEVEALLKNSAFLATSSIMIGDASRDQGSTLANVAGVVGLSAIGTVDENVLRGLNAFTMIAAAADMAAPPAGSTVGGRGADDAPGYPTLTPGKPMLIDADDSLKWPTAPALMPVVNLSLGTKDVLYPTSGADPVNVGTFRAAARQLIVMAAGNAGTIPNHETMSAWAEAPWVLAVGATDDPDGLRLAGYSSVGISALPESGPDLVAYGVSSLSDEKEGTSFAAPRVTRYALRIAAALLQLRHQLSTIRNQAVEGVRLVGPGILDWRGDDPWPGPGRIPAPALPILGVDTSAFADAVALLDDLGVSLDIRVDPATIRTMLLASSRPMPGYSPHQVGVGFVNDQSVTDYLESFSAAHLAWLFGVAQLPTEALRQASRIRVFGHDLQPLFEVVQATAPYWHFDMGTGEYSVRPDWAASDTARVEADKAAHE